MATKMNGKVGIRANNGQGMIDENHMIDTEMLVVVGDSLVLVVAEVEDVVPMVVEAVVVVEAMSAMVVVIEDMWTTDKNPREKQSVLVVGVQVTKLT